MSSLSLLGFARSHRHRGGRRLNLRNSGQDWLPSFPLVILDTVVYRVVRYAASELWRRGWPEGPIIEGACLLDARRAPRAGYGMGARGDRYQTSWSQRRRVDMGLPKLSLPSLTVRQPCRDYDRFLLWGAYSGNACGCSCGGRIHAKTTRKRRRAYSDRTQRCPKSRFQQASDSGDCGCTRACEQF